MISLCLVWTLACLYTSMVLANDAARKRRLAADLSGIDADYRRWLAASTGGDGQEAAPAPSPEGTGSELAGCE